MEQELDILESGMALVEKISCLLDGYMDEEIVTAEYIIRARFSIMMILRWLEKHESDFSIPFYPMVEKKDIKDQDYIKAVEENVMEIADELEETMNSMEVLFLELSPSWYGHVYPGISEAVMTCLENALNLAKQENRPKEDAFLDGKLAFMQMFSEGPLKEVDHVTLLEALYDNIAEDNSCYQDMVNLWYLLIMENEKLPKIQRAVKDQTPFNLRENHLFQTMLSDMIMKQEPFHVSTAMEITNEVQGIQKNGKLQYVFISGTNNEYGISYDSRQYYPHRGFEMYLLDRMTAYLEKKYPEFANCWLNQEK